jgi:hypothetical protein
MVISCVFLAALCEPVLSTLIAASHAIPGETRATTDVLEYAPCWAFQRCILQIHEPNARMLLTFLVRILVRMLITLVVYRCSRRVSSIEDETKRELLQKGASFVRELRGVLALMQELKDRRDRFQNAVEPLKKLVKEESEAMIDSRMRWSQWRR